MTKTKLTKKRDGPIKNTVNSYITVSTGLTTATTTTTGATRTTVAVEGGADSRTSPLVSLFCPLSDLTPTS